MTQAATLDRPTDRQHEGHTSHRQGSTRKRRLSYRITGFLAVLAVAVTPAAAAGSKGGFLRPGRAGGQPTGAPTQDSVDVAKRPALAPAVAKSSARKPTSAAAGGRSADAA